MITENFRANNDQTIATDAGEFMAIQRNIGYASNDGAWVISQLPELYWGPGGVLRQRRPGKLVGIFSTVEDAEQAISEAAPMPIDDQMVR